MLPSQYGGSRNMPVTPWRHVHTGVTTLFQSPHATRTLRSRSESLASHSWIPCPASPRCGSCLLIPCPASPRCGSCLLIPRPVLPTNWAPLWPCGPVPEHHPVPIHAHCPQTHQPAIFASKKSGSSRHHLSFSDLATSQACLASRSASLTGQSAHRATAAGSCATERQKLAMYPSASLTVSTLCGPGAERSAASEPQNGST